MAIQNLKIELTKLILQIDSKELLTKLHELLTVDSNVEFYESISDQKKKEIEITR